MPLSVGEDPLYLQLDTELHALRESPFVPQLCPLNESGQASSNYALYHVPSKGVVQGRMSPTDAYYSLRRASDEVIPNQSRSRIIFRTIPRCEEPFWPWMTV